MRIEHRQEESAYALMSKQTKTMLLIHTLKVKTMNNNLTFLPVHHLIPP